MVAFRSVVHTPQARLFAWRFGSGWVTQPMLMLRLRSSSGRIWPVVRACGHNQAARVEHVRAHLRDPGAWFLVATDGPAVVGMASAEALRGESGAGPVIAGGWFLSYLFVVPERWGEGIGGAILDAVLAEAKRRACSRIHLWTHDDNERSHRLYRSRGFSPTGRTAGGEGEWVRDQPGQ
jgi:GNAT superfamily N-acetyltransferase